MNPKKYLSEAAHELRQVKWPTKNHAVRISLITGIFVIASTIIIGLIDVVLDELIFLTHPATSAAPEAQVNVGDVSATATSGSPIQITTEGEGGAPITITPSAPEDSEATSADTPENPVSPSE